jgi:hypothetical protein
MALLGFDQSLADEQLGGVLTEPAQVVYRSLASNGAGGLVEDFEPGPWTVCLVAPKAGGKYISRAGGGEKSSSMERIEDRTTHVITLPAGTVIDEADNLYVEGRGPFEVLVLERRSTEIGRVVEARELR